MDRSEVSGMREVQSAMQGRSEGADEMVTGQEVSRVRRHLGYSVWYRQTAGVINQTLNNYQTVGRR